MNRTYEVVTVLSPALGEEGLAAASAKIQALIASAGEIVSYDEWGRKRLAYEVDDQHEGHYALTTFRSGPEFPKELERVLKITEGVLRFLVIRKED